MDVSAPSQESERPCVCVLVVSFLPLSVNFLMDFVNVLTICHYIYIYIYIYGTCVFIFFIGR